MKSNPSDSGSVLIEAGTIRFVSDNYGHWGISVGDVVLLGEYTTQDGPMLEDHFFVLVLQTGEEYEAPATASGVDEMLRLVSQSLGTETSSRLGLNIDFSSRIMAPRSLQEQPLYIFEPESRSLLYRLFFGARTKRSLSDSAKSAFLR